MEVDGAEKLGLSLPPPTVRKKETPWVEGGKDDENDYRVRPTTIKKKKRRPVAEGNTRRHSLARVGVKAIFTTPNGRKHDEKVRSRRLVA